MAARDDDADDKEAAEDALAALEWIMAGVRTLPPLPSEELPSDALHTAPPGAGPSVEPGADAEVDSAEQEIARQEYRDALVRGWSRQIDAANYFEILELPTPTSPEALPGASEVRTHFHDFAIAFHPDRYNDAPFDLRAAATHVFGRGAEAYRVLLDPLLSRRYLRLLGEGELRLRAHEIAQAVRGDLDSTTTASLARMATAIPFAEEADDRLAARDLHGALANIIRALSFEPTNLRLEERRRELEARIAAAGDDDDLR